MYTYDCTNTCKVQNFINLYGFKNLLFTVMKIWYIDISMEDSGIGSQKQFYLHVFNNDKLLLFGLS